MDLGVLRLIGINQGASADLRQVLHHGLVDVLDQIIRLLDIVLHPNEYLVEYEKHGVTRQLVPHVRHLAGLVGQTRHFEGLNDAERLVRAREAVGAVVDDCVGRLSKGVLVALKPLIAFKLLSQIQFGRLSIELMETLNSLLLDL